MKSFISLICLLFCFQFAFSQVDSLITITGIISSEDDSYIEYATVGLQENNLATVTDNLGFFKLIVNSNMMEDSLIIKHLGHITKSVTLASMISQKNSKIVLEKAEYGLSEVKVKGMKSSTIVKIAKEKIENNHPKEPYSYSGFFRQLHQENGRYVRLIEADVSVLDKGFYKELKDEKYQLNELRRSYVYEQNGEAHGDHLSDLIHKNPIKHPINTIFTKNGMKYYEFKLAGTLLYDDRNYYEVNFETKDKAHSQMLEEGTLWIDTEDYGILYYKIETINDRGSGSDGNSGKFDWEFIGEAYELKNIRDGDILYPAFISHTYTHNLKHNTFQSMDFELIETFEFHIQNYKSANESDIQDYKQSIDLYNLSYEYDSDYWSSYLPVLNHPLDKRIIKDLEQTYPLDYQFEWPE